MIIMAVSPMAENGMQTHFLGEGVVGITKRLQRIWLQLFCYAFYYLKESSDQRHIRRIFPGHAAA